MFLNINNKNSLNLRKIVNIKESGILLGGSHGHSHLAWAFLPHMAILTFHWVFSPHVAILTLCGHSHLMSTPILCTPHHDTKSHLACTLTQG